MKLTAGLLLGIFIASVPVMALAAGEPPTTVHDRICVCNKVGSCMWVVPGSLHDGLTEADDSKCGGDKKKPTPTWIIETVEPPVPVPTATMPQPDATLEPELSAIFAAAAMRSASDACSIDGCSARETMSAGIATMAAAASKP